MNISLVSYSNGPIELNVELLNNVKSQDFDIDAISQLRYSQDSDFVGFQIDFKIADNNTIFLKAGFLLGFRIEGWEGAVNESDHFRSNRKAIAEIINYAWPIITGILAARCADHRGRAYILPQIDYNNYAELVNIIESPSPRP